MFFYFFCFSLSKRIQRIFELNVSLPTLDMRVEFDKLSNNTAITSSKANNKEKVTIPAFLKCNGVVYKTRILGPKSFSGIETKKVVFPSSLRLIGAEAFANSLIEEITLPDSLTFIDKFAFCNCSNLKFANLSAVYIDDLPEGCFMNCYNLERILLPRVEVIGNSSLESTKVGNDLSIPMSVFAIAERAFFNCTNITVLDLRYTEVTTIESYAFANCANLATIILPHGTKNVYSNIIENTEVTSICVPEDIEKIGKNAFLNTKLRSITSESRSYTVFNDTLYFTPENGKEKSQLIFVPPAFSTQTYRVNRTTEEIMKFAFAKSRIQTILIPLSVRIIHKFAFYSSSISKIQFMHSRTSYSMETIEEGAFYKCQNLTHVDFSVIGIIEIPARCFYKCTSLQTFAFPPKTQAIGSEAFSYTSITNITIPTRTNTIIPGAFSHCHKLVNITLGKGNLVYEISRGILYDYYNNSLLCYPAGLKFRHYTIRPKTLRIAPYAFTDAKLNTVTFNKELVRIGSYAFQGAHLENIVLPESIRFIGTAAFANCTKMTAADMDNATVTILSDYTFEGCSSLENVLLPFALTTFKSFCFRGCSALKVVYFDGTTNIGGTGVFPHEVKVYVTDSYPPNRFLGLKVIHDNKIGQ